MGAVREGDVRRYKSDTSGPDCSQGRTGVEDDLFGSWEGVGGEQGGRQRGEAGPALRTYFSFVFPSFLFWFVYFSGRIWGEGEGGTLL